VAILEVTGSPGAVLPLASRIEALIRAAAPEITGVRIAGPGAGAPGSGAGSCIHPRQESSDNDLEAGA
jgi:hypothetical protein